MFKNKRIVALIPARGDSKRLPRKNALRLAGKPLITWSIEAALKSDYVDTVIVSTDDQELTNISQENGARVPFVRPDELSSDTASTNNVIKHCLDYLRDNMEIYDLVIVLQPTSPLRTFSHIDEGIEFYYSKNATNVVSVCECDHSPIWANTLNDELSLHNFILPDFKGKRSQDIPQYYRLNGALYIFDVAEFNKPDWDLYNQGSYAFIMDKESSIDIDTKTDFQIANFFLSEIKN